MNKISFLFIQILTVLKVYRLSIFQVLPYSLALALLFILMEPQTTPTFVDATDWIALFLFIAGIFFVAMLHACIVYQFGGAIKLSFDRANPEEADSIFNVIGFGIKKIFPVLLMIVLYAILVTIGLVAFIIPGLLLIAIGAIASILIVMKNISPKKAFIEAYHLTAPNWIICLLTIISLFFISWGVEVSFNWIFREQVVVAMFFSVVTRGFLWPLWYAAMITLLLSFSRARVIEGSLNLKLLHQNRRQKFLHIAPNQ